MDNKRPVTQRDLKRKKKQDEETVEITNCSKQSINIQTREPGQDFYLGEASVMLRRNQSVTRPVSRVMMEQLNNLRKRGMIRYRIKSIN